MYHEKPNHVPLFYDIEKNPYILKGNKNTSCMIADSQGSNKSSMVKGEGHSV